MPSVQSIIEADRTKIEQVLINLIKNALKFTKAGHVAFGYTAEEDKLVFKVSDTGIGIPPELRETIFERFRQSSNHPVSDREGSGLGLAISRSFVELMKGTIAVESELEKGSEFTFAIPYTPV